MTFDDLKLKFSKIAHSVIANNRYMFEQIGKMSALQIAKRTRLGYGVSDGKKEKLAPLKPSTVKARKRKRLHSETSTKKSNLTETGQMIDSITYKFSSGKASVTFTNPKAKQKANWAHDGSSNRAKREFMGLTDLEKKAISRWVKEYLVKEIKARL